MWNFKIAAHHINLLLFGKNFYTQNFICYTKVMKKKEKIVECVPNFSEGRRKEVIEKIINEIRNINKIKLLDYSADKDHNRLVVSFVGQPEYVKEAILNACRKAVDVIDMNKHKGEHPRIGAVDVVPFIPISNVSMEECVALAREVGKEIWKRLKVPVYFYGEAAIKPERKDLSFIRRGEYEGLKKGIKGEGREPDLGAQELHPTAGACVVGARHPLIAFNVNLNTSNIEIAKNIAKTVRAKDGGLPFVKAMGFEIKERGIVQVSMNIINYEETSLFRVFELIKAEAKRHGVSIVGSEIVGLVPLNALVDVSGYYLQLENFRKEQILEKKLWEVYG